MDAWEKNVRLYRPGNDYPQEDGVFLYVPEELYHGDRTRLSKHQLDLLDESPLKFRSWQLGQLNNILPKQNLGTPFHDHVANRGMYSPHVVVGPSCKRSEKPWLQFAKSLPPGIIAITEREHALISAAYRALLTNEDYSVYLRSRGFRELTINWTISQGRPIRMRSRLDRVCETVDGWTIVDFKLMQSIDIGSFRRSMCRFRYHVQDFVYKWAARTVGIDVVDFVFLCIENKPPHDVAAYRMGARSLAAAADDFSANLDLWIECSSTGVWPGQAPLIRTVDLYEGTNDRSDKASFC